MPDIERTPIVSPVDRPLLDPNQTALPFNTIAKGAEENAASDLYGMKVIGEIKKLHDNIEIHKAENWANGAVELAHMDMLQNSDYENFPDTVQKTKNALHKELAEKYKDPHIHAIAAGYLENKLNIYEKASHLRAVKLLTDDAKATTIEDSIRTSEAMGNPNSSQEDKQDILDDFKNKVQGYIDTGAMSRKDGEVFVNNLMKDSQKSEIIQLTKSTSLGDIDEGIRRLRDYKNNPYEYVSRTQRAEFLEAALNHRDTVENRFSQRKADVAIDKSMSVLRRMFPDDPAHQISYIDKARTDDKQFLIDNGLAGTDGIPDNKTIDKLREQLNASQHAKEHDFDNTRVQIHEKIEDMFAKKNYSGVLQTLKQNADKLKPEDADRLRREVRSEIRADRAEARAGASEGRESRREERERRLDTSAAEFGKILHEKVTTRQPIDVMKDIYEKVGPNGLTIEDANKLNAVVSKEQKDPKYKLGYDVIQKAYTNGAMDATQRGKALIEFHKKVDVEDASGDRVLDIANEIANPHKESWVKKVINNFLSDKKTPSITENKGSVTPSLTVGKVYTDAAGNKATYRGKDKSGRDTWEQ